MGRRRECRNGASQPETEQTRTDAMPPKTEDVAGATAEARALFALRKASGEEVAVLHTKGDASPMAAGTASKEGGAAGQTSTSIIIKHTAYDEAKTQLRRSNCVRFDRLMRPTQPTTRKVDGVAASAA